MVSEFNLISVTSSDSLQQSSSPDYWHPALTQVSSSLIQVSHSLTSSSTSRKRRVDTTGRAPSQSHTRNPFQDR
jgi:hypothetical protein